MARIGTGSCHRLSLEPDERLDRLTSIGNVWHNRCHRLALPVSQGCMRGVRLVGRLYNGWHCSLGASGSLAGSREDEPLEPLEPLTLIGNDWHALSLVFVIGWHKPPFWSLSPLLSLALIGTTPVIGWHSLSVTP